MTIRPLRTVLQFEATAVALAALLALAAAPSSAATTSAGAAEPAADAAVATVGGEPIRYSQLLEHGREALASQKEDQEQQRLRQQEAATRERHAVLEATLGQWLDERALALEAKAQQSTPDVLLGAVTAEPVTDEEARALYEARKGEGDAPWSQVQAQLGPRVRQFLGAQHQEQARRRYLDGLRLKHGIVSEFAPYRATVPTGGALRGAPTARVTVVEFGDYQCPHCARAQAIVQALMDRHAGTLRVEFHQFPLVRIHPDAHNAALAAVCARAQGRFWEYHDALYADPSNLGLARLQATAESQGLDGKRFAACLQAPATAQAVSDDLRAGAIAGVGGTPAFYVNGRPVPTDADELERVVAEELATGGGSTR
ncbi:MAG: hypothetical protein RL684_1116 [Pseudomonadota bacterium]|jgi:protein-disulfide isomerase